MDVEYAPLIHQLQENSCFVLWPSGARVKLETDGKVLCREVVGARGYPSQSELPLTLGLGNAVKVDRITIQWPGKNGGQEVLTNLAINKIHHIKQSEAMNQAVTLK